MPLVELTELELQRSRVQSEIKLNDSNFPIRKKLRAVCTDNSLERQIYDILEDYIGIQEALRDKLNKELSARYASEFSLIFSSYVAAEMGLDRLLSLNGGSDLKTQGFDYFENKHIDFEQLYPRPLHAMLRALSEAFDYPSKNGASDILEDYFGWVKRETSVAKENPKYGEFISEIHKNGVTIGNLTFKSFDTTPAANYKTNGKILKWDSLGGYEDIKQYFQDLTLLIKGLDHCNQCTDYMPLDERLVKGTLLVGPPNTGKTTMIEIFTHQANISYDQFSVGDIKDKYYGNTSKNIKGRFEAAGRQIRQGLTQVYLLYMMELDSLARERESEHSHEATNDLVTELNIYMRGPKSVPGVIVVADTNRPEKIDSAVLSAGRFTRIYHMGHPDSEGVEKIIQTIVRTGEEYSTIPTFADLDYRKLVAQCDNTPYLSNSGYDDLVKRTVVGGYTGGDIKEIIVTAKRNKLLYHLKHGDQITPITTEDIIGAIQIYNDGRK